MLHIQLAGRPKPIASVKIQSFYTRTQDGVTMANTLYAMGPKLLDGTVARTGTYNEITGVITWSDGAAPWAKQGVPPETVNLDLDFNSGTATTNLYLHGAGMFTGLNSRGPAPGSTTCLAKLPIDPSAQVNHIVISRPHRFVELPPGSLTYIQFYIRDSQGTIIDLDEQGISTSFVITMGSRD